MDWKFIIFIVGIYLIMFISDWGDSSKNDENFKFSYLFRYHVNRVGYLFIIIVLLLYNTSHIQKDLNDTKSELEQIKKDYDIVNENDLFPCPYCESNNLTINCLRSHTGYYVQCKDCLYSGPYRDPNIGSDVPVYFNRYEAMRAWNELTE